MFIVTITNLISLMRLQYLTTLLTLNPKPHLYTISHIYIYIYISVVRILWAQLIMHWSLNVGLEELASFFQEKWTTLIGPLFGKNYTVLGSNKKVRSFVQGRIHVLPKFEIFFASI